MRTRSCREAEANAAATLVVSAKARFSLRQVSDVRNKRRRGKKARRTTTNNQSAVARVRFRSTPADADDPALPAVWRVSSSDSIVVVELAVRRPSSEVSEGDQAVREAAALGPTVEAGVGILPDSRRCS